MPRRPEAPNARVVAVTGAASFLGTELLRQLAEDRRTAKLLAIDIRRPAGALDKTEFYKVDLTLPTADADLAAILAREGADTLVHAAFLSSPTHATAWAHELEDVGTMHVLNACAAAEVSRFILASTTLVYGARPSNPNFLTEDHPLQGGQAPYMRDKISAEAQVRRFRLERPDITVTVLRAAPTLGPTIVNWVSRFFARPVAPRLMGFDPLVQLLHERDLVRAFRLAVEGRFPGEFNVVGDGVLPYSTVLALMGKVAVPMPRLLLAPLTRLLWTTQLGDHPPGFVDLLRFLCVANGDKARQVLGFRPRHDIRATIHDFLGVDDRGDDVTAAEGRP